LSQSLTIKNQFTINAPFNNPKLLKSLFRKNKGLEQRVRLSIGLTNIPIRKRLFKIKGYTGRKSAKLEKIISGSSILNIIG